MSAPSWKLCLLLLALTIAAPPARAETVPAGLSWDVDHALGGVHQVGALVPVHVRLRNDGDADLRLRLHGRGGGREASRRVELPRRSRKDMLLYLGPVRQPGSFEVTLEDSEGAELLATDVTSVLPEPGMPVVGLMGGHPMGWGALRASHEVQVAHLVAEDLPNRSVGLRALDVLVWPDPRLSELSPEQVKAVAEWTAGGGVLILAVNDVWLEASTGSLEPWTDIRPLGVVTRRDLPELAEFSDNPASLPFREAVSVARLSAEQGEAWVQEDFGPILVSERRDFGRVVMMGLDPSEQPVARWPAISNLWRVTLGRSGLSLYRKPEEETPPPSPLAYANRNYQLETAASNVLTRVGGIEPPSVSLLVLVLAVYLLAIGPIDYLVLKRLKKLAWTWVTYPALVALFTLGTWAVANASKSGDPLLHEARIRDLHPETGFWAEESHASFFAVRTDAYELRHKDPKALALAPFSSNVYGAFGGSSRQPVSLQGSAAVAGTLPKWSILRGVYHRTLPSDRASLEASLEWVPGTEPTTSRLGGRLLPRLGVDLEDALLILQVGGKALQVSLGELRDATPYEFEPREATAIRSQEFLNRDDLLPALKIQTARRLVAAEPPAEQREQYVWKMFQVDQQPHHDWSDFLESGGAVLIGRATLPVDEAQYEVLGAEASPQPVRLYVRIPIPPDSIR